jgi:hypothetical protein
VYRMRTLVLGLGLLALLALASVASASSSDNSPGAVYTLANSPGGNAVIAFNRAADSTLTPQGTFATGGSGTGSGLGSHPLDEAVSNNGQFLYNLTDACT